MVRLVPLTALAVSITGVAFLASKSSADNPCPKTQAKEIDCPVPESYPISCTKVNPLYNCNKTSQAIPAFSWFGWVENVPGKRITPVWVDSPWGPVPDTAYCYSVWKCKYDLSTDSCDIDPGFTPYVVKHVYWVTENCTSPGGLEDGP